MTLSGDCGFAITRLPKGPKPMQIDEHFPRGGKQDWGPRAGRLLTVS
jgi:hypothetical protein